jgi:hypothetical protein
MCYEAVCMMRDVTGIDIICWCFRALSPVINITEEMSKGCFGSAWNAERSVD